MTLNDLRKEVAALGFEYDLSADEGFLGAARRALVTIYNEKEICDTLKIIREPIYPIERIERIAHKAGETVRISAKGVTYSFKVSGDGEFSTYCGLDRSSYSFSGGYSELCGFLLPDTYFEFSGDFDYTVYDLCFYDGVYSEGIPIFSKEATYKISEIAEDFLGFSSLPTDEYGNEIKGARILDDRLIIPYDYSGTVCLRYRKAPPRISLDSPSEKIPIPKDVEHLPALLTASYIWLDDDAEKAAHYLSLYREGMAAAKVYGARSSSPSYEDVLRWA